MHSILQNIFDIQTWIQRYVNVWKENLSEKFVQENAGTGGDSITSTLVDYPINLSYLSSRMA